MGCQVKFRTIAIAGDQVAVECPSLDPQPGMISVTGLADTDINKIGDHFRFISNITGVAVTSLYAERWRCDRLTGGSCYNSDEFLCVPGMPKCLWVGASVKERLSEAIATLYERSAMAALTSPDPITRAGGIQSVYGSDAVEPLLRLIAHEKAQALGQDLRQSAILRVAEIAAPGNAQIETLLLDIIQHGNGVDRNRAIYRLGRHGGARALTVLASVLATSMIQCAQAISTNMTDCATTLRDTWNRAREAIEAINARIHPIKL